MSCTHATVVFLILLLLQARPNSNKIVPFRNVTRTDVSDADTLMERNEMLSHVQGAKPLRHRIGVKPHGAQSGSCAMHSSSPGTSYPETHRASTEPGESFQSFHACLAAWRKRRLRSLRTKHMRRITQGSCSNLLSRAQ